MQLFQLIFPMKGMIPIEAFIAQFSTSKKMVERDLDERNQACTFEKKDTEN